MKKHNALKVVVITLLVFILLSWILPAVSYQTEYSEIGRSQVGIFDLMTYQNTILGYFGYASLFVLFVGGFYGVLTKIGAYRKILDTLAKKFKGKEPICLAVIMVLFAFLTSFCNMQLALIMLFPFVISLVLMLGYNKLAATAVTAGSVAVGLIGTTFSYNTTQVLQQYLSVKSTTEIIVRVLLLIIGLVLLIANVLKFGKKEGKKAASDKDEFIPVEVKGNKNKRVWPLVVVLDVILLITILGFISWSSSFNVSIFADALEAIKKVEVPAFVGLLTLAVIANIILGVSYAKRKNKKLLISTIVLDVLIVLFTAVTLICRYALKIKFFKGIVKALATDFPIFQKILGTTLLAFGSWTLVELITVLIVAIIILKFVYGIKWDDVIDGFASGAKKAILPAIIVFIIYAGLVLTTYNPFQLVIYKTILGFSKGFNVFTTAIVVMISTIINADPIYTFYSLLPYFVFAIKDTSHCYQLVFVICQAIYGIVTLVAPTSITLMVTLGYLNVPYKDWLKYIWKLLLELVIVSFVIFTILVLI